jgi:hypothetical protein
MNIAQGKPSQENLPFDLAHLRWPITYSLSEESSAAEEAEEKRTLVALPEQAVRGGLAQLPVAST